jgi:TldD protein
LSDVNQHASAGAAIVQVSAGYGDSRRRLLVANTDGVLAEDEQVRALVRMSVRGVGRHRHHADGLPERRRSRWASRCSTAVDVEALARDAARMALTKLKARPTPRAARCPW